MKYNNDDDRENRDLDRKKSRSDEKPSLQKSIERKKEKEGKNEGGQDPYKHKGYEHPKDTFKDGAMEILDEGLTGGW